MKRFAAVLLVCFGFSNAVFCQTGSPRPEGSAAEAVSLNRLAEALTEAGVPYQWLSYTKLSDAHSFAQTLLVSLAGKLPDRLVIVVPVDTVPGQDAQTSLGWALDACRRWSANPPDLSLSILFAGAERGRGPSYPLSSSQFLDDFFPSETTAVLILDVNAPTTSLELSLVSGSSITPLWLTQSWLETFRKYGFLVQIAGNQPQIFRFDVPEKRTLAQPWFDRGFPTLLVHSAGPSRPDASAAFSASLADFMSQFPKGFPTTSDKNYIVFGAGWGTFFMPQGAYLALLIIFAASITILFLLREPRRGIDLVSWLKSAWQIPVSFFFLFLFLTVSTSILNAIFLLRGFEEFWRYEPLIALSLKISLTLAMYFLFFFQIRRMPLSRWPKFYSYSALFVLVLETLAAAAVELSFSFYFLWALAFAVLFHLVQKRWLKALFFALAPIWFGKAVAEIFWLFPDQVLARLILVSTPLGNLGVSLLLFPFLLLAHSFHYQRHQRQERNEKHRVRILFLFWATLSVFLSALTLRFNPFRASPTPIVWNETLDVPDEKRTLAVTSPVSWGGLRAEMDGAPLPLPRGRQKATLELPYVDDVLTTTVDSSAFLDRTVWKVRLKNHGEVETLNFVLNGDRPIVVYDCNFPFRLENGGKRVRIFVGRNPPSDLTLFLTLAREVSAKLSVTAIFSTSPHVLTLSDKNFKVTNRLEVQDSMDLVP